MFNSNKGFSVKFIVRVIRVEKANAQETKNDNYLKINSRWKVEIIAAS